MSILLPVIGALALIGLSRGLGRLADLLPALAVQQQASGSTTIVLLSQLMALGAQYYIHSLPM